MKIIRLFKLHYKIDMPSWGEICHRPIPYCKLARKAHDKRVLLSDMFERSMTRMGHESFEILANVEVLQKTWALENNVPIPATDWQDKIVLAQIEKLRPDVLYFQNDHAIQTDTIKDLKEMFPFIRMLVLHVGFPLAPEFARLFDLVFVGSPKMKDDYAQEGIKSIVSYHAFDQEIANTVVTSDHPSNRTVPFSFIGSSGVGLNFIHQTRYWFLFELLKETPLQAWLNEKNFTRNKPKEYIFHENAIHLLLQDELKLDDLASATAQFRTKDSYIHLEILQDYFSSREFREQLFSALEPPLPLKRIYPDRVYDSLFGWDMYRKLAESLVTFNLHTDKVRGSACNMRLFEATGIGTCLLTDYGNNIRELFEPDHEVVTYNSYEECLEKLKYLLEHPAEAITIGKAGQKRCLKDHTAEIRFSEIEETIVKKLRGIKTHSLKTHPVNA